MLVSPAGEISVMLERAISGFSEKTSRISFGGDASVAPGAGLLRNSFAWASSADGTTRMNASAASSRVVVRVRNRLLLR